MPNRLATESSPYLRQHADNPVDWYPWGEEAFARARAENKPVLLSVGYAACHWCHVMAHESFENAAIAAEMNARFVNVKVDREERPDVDAIYMQAVQAITGQGGWPMTVALTPDGEPYWGGTYFPPEDRGGMPGLPRVLEAVSRAYHEQPEGVARTAQALHAHFARNAELPGAAAPVSEERLAQAFASIEARFDELHGGFGDAPKFPQAMVLDFCLRWHARTGNARALTIAHRSFVAMARGGMYDQVGGGFARYSTDATWLVPHFEKMLYDNALLVSLGVALWQVTGDAEVRRATERTIDWLAREMTRDDGAFASALDADSEGHEGTFYVWTPSQLDAALGDDAVIAKAYWGVQPKGNFEGRSILHVPVEPALVASRMGRSVESLHEAIGRAEGALLRARARRTRPARDDKAVTAWNALMVRALCEAARVWEHAPARELAMRCGGFLRDVAMDGDGRVVRIADAAAVRRGPGFLDDHAALGLAFLSLHALSLDAHWLADAARVGAAMRAHFFDTDSGRWYDTADDGERLIVRPRDLLDNATPAGQSLALELELRLAELNGDPVVRETVLQTLATLGDALARWPQGFGHLLGVAMLALDGVLAVVLAGPAGPGRHALEREVARRFLPTLLLAGVTPDAEATGMPSLLQGKGVTDGTALAYVCRNFQCQRPVSDASQLGEQLTAPLAGS
jgi:uncharacterized protein YyaL (SSP411 family)